MALLTLTFTSRAPAVEIKAAADAANPECANLLAKLPNTVAGLNRQETSGRSTAVWGTPSGIVLRCGVRAPGPTTQTCATVNGIDWLVNETADTITLTTYGRTPASEVLVRIDNAHAGEVPATLAAAISGTPPVARCVGTADVPSIPVG
ncbi:DUF3515 family protein [Arthrobacter sp. H14-L1]|uniref:DUF3515 family protein n=1 Tax=Arthrobacter sp. H14-L1 TaxID=2996697 RepID=UPI00226D81D3|nr:DUF3515 family protein [Arthrobacter sp. H14-L1]MCY0906219.1 DUF3515 family protein [Arthrobacter sp. H14-L1]